MSIKLSKDRGSILVTILFMTSILALLVAAVANDSFQSMKSISQSGRDTQAKYAAYAGLELALNELRKDESYYGDKELDERHGVLEGEMKGLKKLRYHVLLWNNIQERDASGKVVGDALGDMVGPDEVIVRPDTVYIVSSGTDTVRGEEVLLSSMAGTARRVRPVFEDAAFARTKLALSGSESLVDAWDSNESGEYVKGSFPGETGGGGGGGGGGPGHDHPNTKDYQATLGTDSSSGRTLRLLDGAKLNGHYRVGPGVSEGQVYGSDSGGEDGFAVTTSKEASQIAGVEPTGGHGLGDKKAEIDSKTTEVPKFVSPIAHNDVVTPPTPSNPSTKGEDKHGKEITLPPAPVALAPGGYSEITVPQNQTLELTAGVYFFRDELKVDGGKIITSGDGPVIVFCGKKATFIDADINDGGSTSKLQLCFTDDLKDEATLNDLADLLENTFEGTVPTGKAAAMGELIIKDMISPRVLDEEEATRAGFSKLTISGSTKFHGSISGKNLVALMNGGEIFGSIMANIIKGNNAKIHQDLSLKGSNLMAAGGWAIEGVHQVR